MTLRDLVVLTPLAAALGCGTPKQEPAKEQASPVEPSEEPATPSPEIANEPKPKPKPSSMLPPSGAAELRPIPGADADGPVYFVHNTKGVAKLDAAGVTLVLDKPERNVSDLFVGPDGGVYLLDARSLRKLEGDAVVDVMRFGYEDVAPVVDLAIAFDGSRWVSGRRGLSRHEAGRWSATAPDELGIPRIDDLAVSVDGTAWVYGSNKLVRRAPDEQGFDAVDTSALGRVLLLLHMRASPSGDVFATNGKSLIRMHAAGVEALPLPGAESIAYSAELAVAPDGAVVVASGGCDLVRFEPASEPTRVGRDEYACQTLEDMAVDGRGRIWVASREGLSVIDPATKKVVEYPAGSFAALAGHVSHMAVVGRGPELPEPAAVATTSLIGTVEVEGKPLAQAKVEACSTVELLAEGSPCSAAKRRFSATTDATGQFRLEGLPIGDYSFAVEVAGKWRWTSPPSFAAKLRPGEPHDLGVLTL